jgi:hypothetical protein
MSTAKFQKGEEEDRLRRIRITLSSRNVKALEKGMIAPYAYGYHLFS